MKFQKYRFTILGLLILLNILIRIPSVPHEIGVDSFLTHILANSVSDFGFANWWTNSLSVFGFYPYSYASAVMFILSGISQITGVDMEHSIWLFTLIIGLLSAGFAYLMAGAIWDDDVFKIVMAFCFSLSPGILALTTWDATTRGLFLIFVPLSFYLLIKSRKNKIKFSLLLLIQLVLLTATHHYIFLILPIVFAYLVLIIYSKNAYRINHTKFPNYLINIAYIFLVFGLFLFCFATRTFMDGGWNRFYWLDDMIVTNLRYSGLIIFFAITGFFHLSLKPNKNFEEQFFLIALLFFVPFMFLKTYAHFFIIIFSSVLIGISLTNIAKSHGKINKLSVLIVISILISSISFSGYYQHWRSDSEKATSVSFSDWYMSDATYQSGIWIKESISGNLVGDQGLAARRTFAISETPTFIAYDGIVDLTYGFTTIDELDIKMNSIFSTKFYRDNPVIIDWDKMASRGEPSLSDILVHRIHKNEFDNTYAEAAISRFNLSYLIQDSYSFDTIFQQSVNKEKNNLYNNGQILIWSLE